MRYAQNKPQMTTKKIIYTVLHKRTDKKMKNES